MPSCAAVFSSWSSHPMTSAGTGISYTLSLLGTCSAVPLHRDPSRTTDRCLLQYSGQQRHMGSQSAELHLRSDTLLIRCERTHFVPRNSAITESRQTHVTSTPLHTVCVEDPDRLRMQTRRPYPPP